MEASTRMLCYFYEELHLCIWFRVTSQGMESVRMQMCVCHCGRLCPRVDAGPHEYSALVSTKPVAEMTLLTIGKSGACLVSD